MVQLMIGGIHSGIGVVTKKWQTIDKTNNSQALWLDLLCVERLLWLEILCINYHSKKGLLKNIDVYS